MTTARAEEARRRLDNHPRISELSESFRANPLPGFSSIWLEHRPRYAIVVAGKPSLDRAAVLERAAPVLRPHIVFRFANRDQAEIEQDTDRILEALRPTPGAWSGGYDVKTGKFVFDFEGRAGVVFAKKNMPADLRNDVVIRVGPVPVPL